MCASSIHRQKVRRRSIYSQLLIVSEALTVTIVTIGHCSGYTVNCKASRRTILILQIITYASWQCQTAGRKKILRGLWPWPSLVLCTQRNLTLMALRQNDAGVGGEGLSRVVIAIVMVGQHSLGVVASWCSLAHTWLPTRGLLPQNTQSLPDIDDAHAKLRQECLYVGLQLPLSPQ